MTRTARAIYPRAIRKDRSESKSGYDKSIKKQGAGAHSWGSLISTANTTGSRKNDDVDDDEDDNEDDEVLDIVDQGQLAWPSSAVSTSGHGVVGNDGNNDVTLKRSRSMSAASSSTRSISLTEEDIMQAKAFRKRVFSGGPIDLASIARTSSAASTSPTVTRSDNNNSNAYFNKRHRSSSIATDNSERLSS